MRFGVVMPDVAIVAIAGVAAAASACAPGGARECVIGADCPTGVCRDGMCAPAADAGSAGDAGEPDRDAAVTCANADGVIARDEVPLAAGLRATFRVATDAPIDTAGATRADGKRVWDLSGVLPGDRDVEVELMPVDGAWFAGAFAGATYAAPLSSTADLLGVFEATGGSLLLRGVVSPEGGAGRTELTYEPPVPALAFPIEVGSAWQVTAQVSGTAAGVPALYSERYRYTADAAGQLATPFGTFDVVRIRAELTRTAGAAVTTSRTYLFVSECFGVVASIVSNDYEPDVEFDTAREVRRLAP